MLDTRLAKHNAGNYAGFTVEVAVTAIIGVVPPEANAIEFDNEGTSNGSAAVRESHHEAAMLAQEGISKSAIAEYISKLAVKEAWPTVTVEESGAATAVAESVTSHLHQLSYVVMSIASQLCTPKHLSWRSPCEGVA